MGEQLVVDMVKKLEQKSLENKVLWEKTSTEDEFQATVGKSIIRSRSVYDNGYYYYYLDIFNSHGSLVETISKPQLEGLSVTMYDSIDYSTILERIYKHAKRKAYGVDEELRGIMDELDKE